MSYVRGLLLIARFALFWGLCSAGVVVVWVGETDATWRPVGILVALGLGFFGALSGLELSHATRDWFQTEAGEGTRGVLVACLNALVTLGVAGVYFLFLPPLLAMVLSACGLAACLQLSRSGRGGHLKITVRTLVALALILLLVGNGAAGHRGPGRSHFPVARVTTAEYPLPEGEIEVEIKIDGKTTSACLLASRSLSFAVPPGKRRVQIIWSVEGRTPGVVEYSDEVEFRHGETVELTLRQDRTVTLLQKRR